MRDHHTVVCSVVAWSEEGKEMGQTNTNFTFVGFNAYDFSMSLIEIIHRSKIHIEAN